MSAFGIAMRSYDGRNITDFLESFVDTPYERTRHVKIKRHATMSKAAHPQTRDRSEASIRLTGANRSSIIVEIHYCGKPISSRESTRAPLYSFLVVEEY